MAAEWGDFGGRAETNYEIGEVEIFCPCGCEFYVDFDTPRPCPKCGREYRAEVSVRVFVREGAWAKQQREGGK